MSNFVAWSGFSIVFALLSVAFAVMKVEIETTWKRTRRKILLGGIFVGGRRKVAIAESARKCGSHQQNWPKVIQEEPANLGKGRSKGERK